MAWDSKRHRFKEVENLPYRGEWAIRCELTVSGYATEFPLELVSAKADEMLSIEISKGKLYLLMCDCRGKQVQWFSKIRKAGCVAEAAIIESGYPRFSVVALATFQPPRHMDVSDIREWDTIGPSAGLPSLGRRR